MALELGPRRIAIDVVAERDRHRRQRRVARDSTEADKAIGSQTALGRVGGPEDVGPVIAALLSDGFRWVNGERIEVAGGFHL